ncbi:hypothetical protein LEP1GSC073_1615 [Leptospira noguchii str. Cascata]|nr:hypothetical protein LEP1GSC072_1290 [Leptospira noguchii str. Bonito]EMS83187.1 hypothetical protein LEP1GSC073_1615 [Leptospira noguchii str. Cascata]
MKKILTKCMGDSVSLRFKIALFNLKLYEFPHFFEIKAPCFYGCSSN